MNKDSATSLLADLIAIPSMNPMGRRSGNTYSERNLAEFLAGVFKHHHVDTELYEALPGRPNLEAFVEVGAENTLLLEAHMDTVHADNMTVKPFGAEIRDGRMYGRGSCDTKGSIAAFCTAVLSLLDKGTKLNCNVRFLFVSDEEYTFAGAQAAVQKGLKATFGIAGEPTQLSIVRAHKGVTRWRIRTTGTAAHSAYPERGRNAIYAMAPVVEALSRHADELSRRTPHPVLGAPSLSVGVIEGGQVVNMVPDACWVEVDRRSLPGESTEEILAPIKNLLKASGNATMDPPYLSVAGMDIPEESEIVRSLGNAVKEVTGAVRIETAQYATDAGVFVASGIPTAVFGPGDIAQAHTDSEYLELEQLDAAVGILQTLIAA